MMGYRKLCLLLMLSSYTLAQEGNGSNEQTSTCLLASRFKSYKKYVYQYTATSTNGVVGTANLKNGPKVSCQVEIEVPQLCRFFMHTRDCTLSEVSVMDPQGQPVYRQAPGSEAFQAAMERNLLRFTVEGGTSVQLFPETDEPVNILNIKRGIVSALNVPVMDEEQSRLMSTVHGQCLTDYLVHARKDIATDVTLSRDLSQCDQFYSRKLVNSPLALLQKLHGPMSKLITSTQDCNYQFDNKGKHITTAMCTEKHIYLPFSHKGNGISSVVTQDLNFQSSKRINNKAFDVNPSQSKPLYFEEPDDKAPIQTKDAVLGTLQELVALAGTDQGQKRTSLFHKLVSSLRVLRNETLSQIVTKMFDMSGWLTLQALFQCGTTECTSAILHAIRTFDGLSPEVDALVYGLSLQTGPDATRVRDMLSMAQYKQSRAIMYALANTVKKFYKSEVTPVVTDVSKFMETLLHDCIFDDDSDFSSDREDMSFLVLRVVGVMGEAMQAVSPSLISSILRCARKTNIPLSNQKAAIQAFRLMDINDEVRNILLEVYKDTKSPVEKRVAAYLILMKNPDQALVRDILYNLSEDQLKSFVVSHLKNIGNSGEPQMDQLREYIELALKDQPSPSNKVFAGMSSNYKIDSPLGSVQSNIIFDATDTLPKEVMLETTLKVFDYNYDIFEIGVDGTGFEPTIDALFGENGFFPDSISKVMYWAGDKAKMLREVLAKMAPERDSMKRQVPQDLLKDITNSIQKLMDDVHFSSAPEAIAYLRLLGAELGYIKTGDMKKMAETLSMYYNVFIKVLPVKAYFALTSSTENELFGHYIFMENTFFLPTASGFPLKFSMAGVFAPGAKGGLTYSTANTMTDLSFMPSVGLEIITQMGVHIPDYVEAGIEMHTNIYHESSLNAKITMSRNQMRLIVPAPKSNTQLFSISNKLLLVSSGQTKIMPSLVEDRTDSSDCQPLFYGLKLCTIARYSNATSMDQAPYYPLTGESRFAVEIQPTGEVSEYTATITDETLRDGRKGRHKVHSLTLTLKAEGHDSSETTVALRYNQNKNTLTAEVDIPDYDVEAGIKLAITDSDAKGKKMRGITIDVTNRNLPQLTLVGHSRLDMMKNAMLQLQMAIPYLKTDASVTATLKRDEDVFMDLETVINLPETSYQQKASLKYNDDIFEVELKSHLKSEIQKLIPVNRQLQQLINHILDQKVTNTDMKLRHIVTKGIEAGDIWLDKLTTSIPYLANLRSKRSISDLTLPALAEKLFLQFDSLFRYQFNKDKMAISLPLPHGGKKSEEINIPTSLSIPLIDLPAIGLYIPAKNYPLPSFSIPPSLDFTVPLLGLAEASTKINSNVYSWEGSITVGNYTVDVPSYIAQYKAMAQSPFHLLSYKLEAIATLGFDNGLIKLNGKYNFIHSDIKVDWQHVLAQNLRMKRQTPQAGSLESRNTFNVDITSRTFIDAHFRFASRKDGITASMSCPSAGFLGLQFQRRSPSQFYGTLFSRNLSTPEKDTDVFTAKAMLRNSQFMLQTSWNWDFLHDVIEGTKKRIPAITDALLKFINKYHTAHFGFDLKRGVMKLKNEASSAIERVYHGVPVSFTTLHNIINHLSDKGKYMYMKASESLMSMSVQDVIDMLTHNARQLLKHINDLINVFTQSVTQFMSETKFTVPGSEEKLSSLEMFQGVYQSVSRATKRAIQRFASPLENISKYIREINFTIPRTDVVFTGNEIMDKLMCSIRSVYDQVRHSVGRGYDLLKKKVNELLQVIGEKAKDFITHLKEANVEIASQVDAIHAEVLQAFNQHTEEAKRYLAEYRNHAKMKIHMAYNALRMEKVNNYISEFISILQSHLYSGMNESADLMRRTSQSTAPYIRVSNKKMDIEIPLPFLWKSFSKWPTSE
ncbi:apolipoprotein B-100 isoform X3 [Etheostoma cragini]|uniref:apolipoprotein B-100 isoform X3 n=1 Tax=Etheostoma cragini TaxID=417921 RepID=UPI00155EC953|nr:apolipoprotein B-100 isoform X3 [Etheostoma cragini]